MPERMDWPDLSDEELLIAVANTAHGEFDELADGAAIRAWWRGLGAPGIRQRRRSDSHTSAAMLRTLRGVIRGLAMHNNGITTEIDTSGLNALTLHPDLLGEPSLRADEPDDLAQNICAVTVTALLRARARPGWPRLKACRGDDCRWVFVDNSRNTSRRWCDMAGCGSRAKAASFRVRRRTAGTTA